MQKPIDVKWLTNKITKSKSISDLTKVVLNINESLSDVVELIRFTYDYCEKLKMENLQIYNESVKPLLIIVSNCEKSLQKDGLSDEKKTEICTTLFQSHKDISIEGEKLRRSRKRNLAVAGGGFSIGVIAGAIVINNITKKSIIDHMS